MAKPLRSEFAGALYHVTVRGDGREAIYLCDADRRLHLDVLAQTCEDFNWHCHAYCLMDDHCHLLVETPDANLSKGMRQLSGAYADRFNGNRGRSGHPFQGKGQGCFEAVLVQKENSLLELARHIVLSPVRAQLVPDVGDWPWSSYRATAGLADVPDCLIVDGLLSAFGEYRAAAINAYKEFVQQGLERHSSWACLQNPMCPGNELFIKEQFIEEQFAVTLLTCQNV